VRWGLLVRISDDRDGEGAGVARQEKDGRALVRERNGTVAQLYRENSTSAYKRKVTTLPNGRRERRTVRPEFRRALDDLYRGRIDALAVYDLDRFVRDPRDLEDAVDVVEDTGRPIAAVTGSIDLSTDHGITAARMLVAVKNQESRDTARRVKRMHVALADEGRPSGGRRPYGYTGDRLRIVDEEAGVIRELAGRRLAGEGWVSLVRDLNARGIPAASGGRWTLSGIRSALLKPHVAGVRVLRGQETADGVWPAILDRATWEQLGALAQQRHPPTRRFLLSGIARCVLCGSGLGGRDDRGVLIYRCTSPSCGHITRRMAPLDDYVTGVALTLLADLDLTPSPHTADPAAAERLRTLLARRVGVVAAFADVNGDDPVELRQSLAALDADITRARTALGDGGRSRVLAAVQGITAEQWQALPLDVRRTVLAALVTVRVGRSARGRVPFDTASVQVEQLH
jgi:DNA invertase Pin-like site-specific DNA recombinase